jgi:hypothetical protein
MITGCANLLCGLALTRSAPRGAVPLQTGMRPSTEMTRPQRALHWTMILGGWTQLLALGSALAVEAALDV